MTPKRFTRNADMTRSNKAVLLKPIGTVHTDVGEDVPRHWIFSDKEGTLNIEEKYLEGLKDIKAGQRIVVIFHFHKSPPFTARTLSQKPPHRNAPLGVFSICSPIRPNPIGISVLEILDVQRNVLRVKGVDMMDGTPILDIKPLIDGEQSCPSYDRSHRLSSPEEGSWSLDM
jgi:tRNA-Thr(GGU) m(6)t(6)A37 methyltransferase TsaA